MKIKKTFGLFFVFVFITSLFLGTTAAAIQGDQVLMLNARYCNITNPSDGATA